MWIDEIRREKGHLVGLYSGGELIVSLDCDLADEQRLQAGRDYPVETLQSLLAQSQQRRARAKALWLLEFRDYSRRDLEKRLRKDFDETSAADAAAYMEEIGAVDDRRYAESVIRHLVTNKHYGRRRILQELSLKGIDRDTAEEALDAYDFDESEAIETLLATKFAKDLDTPKGINRTVATLTRYGFSYGDIRDALYEYIEAQE